MPRKFIIDTDGAADDVRAISLALQTPSVQVLAISTVRGVVGIDQVVANVARTLRANRASVPVFKGAFEPLVAMTGHDVDESFFFGKDGIGDKPNNFPKVVPEDFTSCESAPAAIALVELLRKHDDVTLVCLGPLTNIAMALKLDKEFARRPKEVVIMGGNVYGVGNMKSRYTAEFNFGGDPEAAHIVLAKMECPVTLVPWEAFFFEGVKHQDEVDFNAHLKLGTPLSDFLATATSLGREILERNGRKFAYCDEIAMATAIDPDRVVNDSKTMRASVELNGEYTRGQVACDWTERLYQNEKLLYKLDKTRRPIRFVVSYDVKVVDRMVNDAVRNAK